MGDAAAVPWGTSPIYRPPDARPEWEEPVRRPRPRRPLAVFRSGVVRIDATRAEDALEDITLAQARRALALRRRLHRATAQATRAVELRLQAQAVEVERVERVGRDLARLEQEQREEALARKRSDEARRSEGRDRLALANKLERSAELLRAYEEWARSRGLPCAGGAGLSAEAERLGRRVEELRYG